MVNDQEKQVRDLLARIGDLDERDFRPRSIIVLIAVVVAAGVASILWPAGEVRLETRYLPTLLYGLISLVLLYNIYILWQGRALRAARAELVRELLRADAAERMALTDPLTGVFNRRHLKQALEGEIKRAERSGSPLSLMILDLDDFGLVNKREGHTEGDRLLCDFAGFLLKSFRQTDTIVRYGGDEFVVLLPDTSEKQAEKPRRRFDRLLVRWNAERQGKPPLTVSVGVAAIGEGFDADDALELADARLRQAKVARSDLGRSQQAG